MQGLKASTLRPPMSALGQKQTYAAQQVMSALPPIAAAKADTPQMVMSALHPKADMCSAARHVRFGPIADTRAVTRTAANARLDGRAFAVS